MSLVSHASLCTRSFRAARTYNKHSGISFHAKKQQSLQKVTFLLSEIFNSQIEQKWDFVANLANEMFLLFSSFETSTVHWLLVSCRSNLPAAKMMRNMKRVVKEVCTSFCWDLLVIIIMVLAI